MGRGPPRAAPLAWTRPGAFSNVAAVVAVKCHHPMATTCVCSAWGKHIGSIPAHIAQNSRNKREKTGLQVFLLKAALSGMDPEPLVSTDPAEPPVVQKRPALEPNLFSPSKKKKKEVKRKHGDSETDRPVSPKRHKPEGSPRSSSVPVLPLLHLPIRGMGSPSKQRPVRPNLTFLE